MHRIFIVLLFVLTMVEFFALSAPLASIKPVSSKPVQIKTDSSKVQIRNFDQQKIKDYHKQREFVYDDTAPVNESLWDRFWRWLGQLTDDVLNNKYSGGFVKYLVIAVLVVFVVFAIIKVIGLDLKIFTGKSKPVEIQYSEYLDNIHEINFNDEIEKAIAGSNYRLAVRLFYLRTLKTLNDQALISWQPEKTNSAYINEIANPDKKQQFSELTSQFEYIWYGEFFIDKENFNQVKNSFDQFNLKTS